MADAAAKKNDAPAREGEDETPFADVSVKDGENPNKGSDQNRAFGYTHEERDIDPKPVNTDAGKPSVGRQALTLEYANKTLGDEGRKLNK